MERITFIGPGGQVIRGEADLTHYPQVGDLVTAVGENMVVSARRWNYDTLVLTIYLAPEPPAEVA